MFWRSCSAVKITGGGTEAGAWPAAKTALLNAKKAKTGLPIQCKEWNTGTLRNDMLLNALKTNLLRPQWYTAQP